MSQWITAILLVLGAILVLLASIGVLRMPDLFTRLHTAAKAPTLGCGLILGAVAGHFGTLEAVTIAMVTAAFIVLTSPVAAHMIARAAYLVGVPLWEKTVIDELRGLRSPPRAKGDSPPQGPDNSDG